MSLIALLFMLTVVLLALSWESLLWWAVRRGNRVVLLHSSGLVLLAFVFPLSIAFYDLLGKLHLQVSWPWSWVSSGLMWCLVWGIVGPFVLLGIDLLWNGPRHVAAPSARIDWSELRMWLAIGCLLGIVAGFHWLGISSPLAFLSARGQGSAPTLFGAFSLDGFWQGFLWGSWFGLLRAYKPQLIWWGQTFSERRWFVIATTLLVLGVVLITALLI